MGCTQSKIEDDEAVTRCKERKQFMKEAVSSRNAFAAAHSGYTVGLKNTGAALSDYGHGEVLEIQSATPTPAVSLPPPPPPLPNFGTPPPLQRAATMPELSIPKPETKPTETITEEEDDDLQSDEIDGGSHDHDLSHHRRSRRNHSGGGGIAEEAAEPPLPPSPPPPSIPPNDPVASPQHVAAGMAYHDFFFPNDQDMPGSFMNLSDEIRPGKDEVDGGGYDVRPKMPENLSVDGGNRSGSSVVEEPKTPKKVIESTVAVKPAKKPKQVAQSQTVPVEANKRGGKAVSSVNLLQILNEVDELFLKASESAHGVSKLLEANRLHYHSNFADNRGHIDHSAKLMRVITWNRSIKGLQSADDGNDDDDPDETLATVLDKLLAWEKKLYDEVKAGELMKLEYQRKVGLLNKQKNRGTNSEALEKTKAAVSHLHTRYIVDMQSMDSTVSEIENLRDDKLYPKLVDLVDGMAKMWETMNVQHKGQMKIVEHLRYLDASQAPKETSEEHHNRTIQLWSVVEDWNAQFKKLVTHQKEFIRALNRWLKLNLIPVESNLKEKVSSPPRVHRPPIQPLLLAWQEYLEKLPDDLARNAITSFAAIINTIRLHQEDEGKQKQKCEETRKEIERKNRAFNEWYHKHMQRRTPPDDMDHEKSEDVNPKDPVAERQFAIESLKMRLDEEVEAHQRLCRQVREKSLGTLKNQLPELFRAMSDVSLAFMEMYKNLQSISWRQDPSRSPSLNVS